MKVLYHIPHPNGLGADRWICDGWREGFSRLGHEFYVFGKNDDLAERVSKLRPHLFFSAINLLDVERPQQLALLRSIRNEGTKVLLWVHWPLEKAIPSLRAEILMHEDIADIYFGERESEQMDGFERDTGKPYHVIPNAANPVYHFPVEPDRKYDYDVVYLGAKLGKKRWFIDNVLSPLRKKFRVGLFGPGWTLSDNFLRALSKACRKATFYDLAGWVDGRRLALPPQDENRLYSSAKISLNFHEREEDGSQPHYIVNQRAFKIPACGGFQICDHVPALDKYFNKEELVTAYLDPYDWIEKVEYYLSHEQERQQIRSNGTKRALRDHMSTNRVQQVLRLIDGPS